MFDSYPLFSEDPLFGIPIAPGFLLAFLVSALLLGWFIFRCLCDAGDWSWWKRTRKWVFASGIAVTMVSCGVVGFAPGFANDLLFQRVVVVDERSMDICDDRLREMMLSNPQYREQRELEYLSDLVKAIHPSDCADSLWHSHVVNSAVGGTGFCGGGQNRVGGVVAPSTLLDDGGLSAESQRDAAGNILVYIAPTLAVSGGNTNVPECWLYLHALGQWSVGHR